MEPLHYFDAHCHLQDDRYAGSLDVVITRAYDAGVKHMVCCATQENDWEPVLSIAQRYSGVLPAIGIHPWFAGSASHDWLVKLEASIKDNRYAIGECGLDFAVENADRAGQEAIFKAQVLLAKRSGRPVIVHCRRAWQRCMELLEYTGTLPAGGMLHSYSGSHELVKVFESMGFFISFSGSVTYPLNRKVRKSCLAVSDHRLLIETDSPDIFPAGIPVDGEARINEPSFVPTVARAAAEIRGTSVAAISKLTFDNGVRMYRGRDR